VPAVYGFMVLYAGFIIIPPAIPDWWIWLYYLSTFHYGLEGLLVNEFVGYVVGSTVVYDSSSDNSGSDRV
jgi:ABC-type multidrug transport system permease subunit